MIKRTEPGAYRICCAVCSQCRRELAGGFMHSASDGGRQTFQCLTIHQAQMSMVKALETYRAPSSLMRTPSFTYIERTRVRHFICRMLSDFSLRGTAFGVRTFTARCTELRSRGYASCQSVPSRSPLFCRCSGRQLRPWLSMNPVGGNLRSGAVRGWFKVAAVGPLLGRRVDQIMCRSLPQALLSISGRMNPKLTCL